MDICDITEEDEVEIYCFDHISKYYWNLYVTTYTGSYNNNRNGQLYVAYKELSLDDDDEHVELNWKYYYARLNAL